MNKTLLLVIILHYVTISYICVTVKLRKSKYSVDSLLSGLQELADLIETDGIVNFSFHLHLLS